MRAWKNIAVSLICLLAASAVVQADEANSSESEKKSKHMVDMADGLNSQQFMDSKNPDALWSSTMYVPWKRSGAIDAFKKDETSPVGKDGIKAYKDSDKKEENLAMPAPSSEFTGVVDGKKIDTDQLVNIRAMYGLDSDHTKAPYTPVSAQNELFRQMSKFCSFGFQKVGEWSELVEGSDYYLYYQFQCIEKR